MITPLSRIQPVTLRLFSSSSASNSTPVITSTVPTAWTQPGVRSITVTSRPRPMFDNFAEEVSGEM